MGGKPLVAKPALRVKRERRGECLHAERHRQTGYDHARYSVLNRAFGDCNVLSVAGPQHVYTTIW